MDKEEAAKVVEAAIEAGLAKCPEQPMPKTELAIAVPATLPAQPITHATVTAEKPQEMEEAQVSLIDWAKSKIASLEADYKELDESYKIAIKNKWRSGALLRHRDKAAAEIVYYTKMLGALEAGYILVPNMPGAVFSVRTDKVCPSKTWKYSFSEAVNMKAGELPIGEGQYVSGQNKHDEHQITDAAGKTLRRSFRAIEFGEIGLPMALAKPRIMEATSRAMALRIFDEFMILPPEVVSATTPTTVTRHDPIILGCVVRRVATYTEKRLSFMIAWHIDTRAL